MSAKKTNASFDAKRRKLLKLLGLGGAVAAGQSVAGQVRVDRQQPVREVITAQRAERYVAIKLLRTFDLLSLELRYYNFSVSRNTLVKRSDPAYLVVIFQPQTMSEQAWNETATPQGTPVMEPPTIPGRILIGGESRLVFQIPSSVSNIKLDVNELLDWDKYEPVVNDRARQPARRITVLPRNNNQRINSIQQKLNTTKFNPRTSVVRGMTKDEKLQVNSILIADKLNSRADAIVNVRDNFKALSNDPVGPLGELETSLEVPLRLYLSPTKIAGWNHISKLQPDHGIIKASNKLFELWHTRMGTKTSKGVIDETDLTADQRLVRALWADDAQLDYKATVIEKVDNMLGVTSMSNKDRHQIVHESSNFQIPRFVPPPIKAYKLFLSTLGAWLDSEFVVERKKLENAGVLIGDNNSLNLLKWRHIETLGREHYVEIVKAGNIMPFGHEAVLIKITERKPHPGTGTAANFQRKIVVITEPIKDYNYRDSANVFLNFSFSKIEMITTISPLLDATKKKIVDSLPGTGDEQFVITSGGGSQVLFKVKGTDLDGNHIDFSLPLAFVSTDVLGNDATIASLAAQYNTAMKVATHSNFNGQKFTLAQSAF